MERAVRDVDPGTTAVLLDADPLVTVRTWLQVCIGFNIIFTTLSLMLFDHLLEE